MNALWQSWQAAIDSPLGLSLLWLLSAAWLLHWAWRQRQAQNSDSAAAADTTVGASRGARAGATAGASAGETTGATTGASAKSWALTPEVRKQLPWWLRLLWLTKREIDPTHQSSAGVGFEDARRAEHLVQQQKLERAGLPSELTVSCFNRQRRTWRMLCTLACGALVAPLTQLLGWVAWPLLGVLWTTAVVHPWSSLRAATRQRQAALAAQLPFVMELLVLGLESGHNLSGAWALVAHHAPAGQGRDLAQRHMADLRTGLSRTESLRRLSQLYVEPGLTRVASTLIQSDALGGQLVPLLRRQSEQLLQAAAQRAEQQAVELPVRLLAPLLLCIFPCTFLILGWPIAYKLGQWL